MTNIAAIRKDYQLQQLDEAHASTDAISQFNNWWQDAIKSNIEDVNACTLATASSNAKPSARIVLLKGFDQNGFVFFTNYQSHKGRELDENPQACMVFYWKELERQIRIEGLVQKVAASESDDYFLSRPTGSQLGAWASPQSTVITNRQQIEENVKKYEAEFENKPVTRPEHWGGYLLQPQLLEFWQGRSNRLHDRLQYNLQENGQWQICRLAP